MRQSTRRAVIFAFGILMVMSAGARARADEAGSSRESIIEGVRDDVRRKIQERNEIPPENRPNVASEAKQPTNAPVDAKSKQDTPK